MARNKPSGKKPFYSILKIWNPVNFQGGGRHSKYFEGWYFKNISPGGKHILSVIPGISVVNKKERHAFIQLIDGKTAQSRYFKYPFDQFGYSRDKFEIWVGKSSFTLEGINLDIEDSGSGYKISGHIKFNNIFPLKSALFNPGIMGWYSFVPFMECNHGLVSMDHNLSGMLKENDTEMDFSGGRGYAEKDWGRSMPSAWIWMQSNHFENDRTSFMLSVAKIPWLKSSFTGFLCVLLIDGKLHRFATYTGAKLTSLAFEKEWIDAEIKDKNYRIHIRARHASGGLLAAPLDGAMDRRIAESIDAVIILKVSDRSGNIIFSGEGLHAGLEMVGDMKELPL